ncbi:MAG: helix-turn-helix domain-containing protein [Chitinivibrionales bacterium]|nr:helix-turn-helix domain-containing protein [Chitinivibrionales bacterium]
MMTKARLMREDASWLASRSELRHTVRLTEGSVTLRVRFLWHSDVTRDETERWTHPRTVVSRVFLPLGARIRVKVGKRWRVLDDGVFALLPEGTPFEAEYGPGRMINHSFVVADSLGLPVRLGQSPLPQLDDPELVHAVRNVFARNVPGEVDAVAHRVVLNFVHRAGSLSLRADEIVRRFPVLPAVLERTPPASWRVAAVADAMGESAPAVAKRFKRAHRVTLKRFLRQVLMARAKDALLASSLPASTVAGQLGFEDPAYFHRLFQTETGMTPNQWRRACDR